MYNFNKCLKNKITNWENHTEGLILHKEDLMQNENERHKPKLARVVTLINPSASYINPATYTSSMIVDTMFPDRKPCSADSANTILGRRIFIPCKISDKYGLYK